MDRLRICLAAAEAAPFAKTGGLADVTAALTRELHRRGHDLRLFLPLYRRIREAARSEDAAFELEPDPELQGLPIWLDGREWHFGIQRAPLAEDGPRILLVDCPELYDREDLYGDGPDEPLRWALLAHAALHTCQRLGFAPQILHAHDWHAALLPLLVRTHYAWDRLFEETRTVLTLHNLGYQGVFPAEWAERLGFAGERERLPAEDLAQGVFNFLKTGILETDLLTTVSPTYAREIQTPEQGHGLDGVLRERSGRLLGILNGVDTGEWSPAEDRYLPATYDARDLAGKAVCRETLLRRFHLAPRGEGPVLGIVSRLVWQKGIELLEQVLPVALEREDLRLCVLGTGEERYERFFHWLQEAFPGRAGFHCGFSNELAHLVEAGSDLFLMPSRYEPCGLNQMYSMLYGTPPVVRRTGGLADTVREWDPEARTGTGFLFEAFEAEGLFQALTRALRAWRDPEGWRVLMRNGMLQDFSWSRRADSWLEVFQRLLAN